MPVQTYADGHPPTSEVNTTGLAVTDDTLTVGQLFDYRKMAIGETGSVEAERLAISRLMQWVESGRKLRSSKKWHGIGRSCRKSKKLIIKDKVACLGVGLGFSKSGTSHIRENNMLYYPTFTKV